MNAPAPICLDASFAAAMLLPEPTGPQALALWQAWAAASRQLIAPPHFGAETVSAFRRRCVRGDLSPEREEEALDAFLGWLLPGIRFPEITPATWRRAWEWARELNRAGVYDTLYLALAEAAGAEFWTTDGNLVRALQADGRALPDWVHPLAEE